MKPHLKLKKNYFVRCKSSESVSATLNALENIRELRRSSRIILKKCRQVSTCWNEIISDRCRRRV